MVQSTQGMVIEEPSMVRVHNPRNDSLVHELKRQVKDHHKLVVGVFTAKQDDRYRFFIFLILFRAI